MILHDVIVTNHAVSKDIYRLVVENETISRTAKPGQFVNLQIDSELFTLRRPFGIAGVDRRTQVEIFYRVVGRGTNFLTTKQPGESVDLLSALGHGFDVEKAEKIFVVGGGVGLAPLLFLCRESAGKKIHVFAGGKTAEDLFWKNFFRMEFTEFIGDRFPFDDFRKFVEADPPDLIVTVAPEIMMRGVAKIADEFKIPCQVSLEKRMACGLGACLGCSIDTIHGRKKVCKDGPVFYSSEVFL